MDGGQNLSTAISTTGSRNLARLNGHHSEPLYQFDSKIMMPFSMRLPNLKGSTETAYKAVENEANSSVRDVSAPATIPGWPTNPQRIASAPLWIIVDFLLLLLPIAFISRFTESLHSRVHLLNYCIVLAALAWRLDGQELSSKGRSIEEAILLGPTLFPLAFAALGGRSLKRIALWRAQRGTTVGVRSLPHSLPL
jgi:hypothetical protein